MNADERIVAYVDGELDAAERTAFEARMAADPSLAEAVAAHRKLAALVSGAYAPVLDEPVPPHLQTMSAAASDPGSVRRRLPVWAAVAASLAVGVLAGRLAPSQPGPPAPGRPIGGELETALNRQLAGAEGPIRVRLSYLDRQGRYCRTFESRPLAVAGLACREDDDWVAQTVTQWNPGPRPQFEMAASGAPPEVLAAVDRTIAGEPLDAAAERAAVAGAWRRAGTEQGPR